MSEPWSYPPAWARPDRTKPAKLVYDEASKQLFLEFYDTRNRLYRLPVTLTILPPEVQELRQALNLSDLFPVLRLEHVTAAGNVKTAIQEQAIPLRLEHLTVAGNVKTSVEEQSILVGVDVQARYGIKVVRTVTPTATGTFYLPETGAIDLSNFASSSWYVYAPTTANMVIDVYLQASHDGGTTWYRVPKYKILNADFVRDAWNVIDCPSMLAHARLEVVISGAYPSTLIMMVIAKA